MAVVASAAVVLLSTLAYSLLVWWADRHEKEPKRLLLAALLWGAVPAAIISVLLELGIDQRIHLQSALSQEVFSAGIAGPFIEEMAKGLMLVALYKWWRLEFDGLVDGLVYGALVGFGFAMMENFLYFINAAQQGVLAWTALVILRQFVFGLNHAFFTSFTGMGLGLARWSKHPLRWLYPLVGFGMAVFVHALHNITLTLTSVSALSFLLTLFFDLSGILLVLVIWVLAVQRESRLIREELADEVGHALSAEEYAALSDGRGRLGRLLRGQLGSREDAVRAERLLAELAIKKHQLKQCGDDKAIRLRIAQLYAELVHLRERTQEPGSTS